MDLLTGKRSGPGDGTREALRLSEGNEINEGSVRYLLRLLERKVGLTKRKAVHLVMIAVGLRRWPVTLGPNIGVLSA